MTKIKPLRNYVLVKPVPYSPSELAVATPRKPVSGHIYSIGPGCKEDLREGDFVAWEEHGLDQPNSLQDTFFIKLKDGDGYHTIRADADIEPVLRETVQRFEKRGDDRWITCYDLSRDREPIKFLSSDVVDYGFATYTESGYILDYINVAELDPLDTGLDFTLYLVPLSEILFTVRPPDDAEAKD